jgi:SAM-dependent methyltransferase
MFDYSKIKYEYLVCNFCGGRDQDLLSDRDRYGLAVRTVICRSCGLIFINPRMTAESYRHFYETAYRDQVALYKGAAEDEEVDLDRIFSASENLGFKMGNLLKPRLNSGLTIEVGSSCGGILSGLKRAKSDLELLGIEPSPKEAEYAVQKGIPTHISMFENFHRSLRPAQNIVMVKTLNHLLDPKEFIAWSYRQLVPGGKLILHVLNFIAYCQRKGRIKTQIDHPYMFTPQTLSALVTNGGFDIEYQSLDKDDIYLVGRRRDNFQPFGDLRVDSAVYRKTRRALAPRRLKTGFLIYKAQLLADRFKKAVRRRL